MDTRTLKKIYSKLSQEDKIELKSEKVELAESVIQLLKYHKGVEIFSENINIDIKEIDSAKNSLEVDLKDLMSDMEKLAKGINSADTAAKLLGMSVSEIPNYNKAIQAAKLGFKQEAKAKKYLK
jgi:hypothetical protein